VKEMLALGASAVELYSALVYKGPFLIYSILKELKKEGFFNNQSAK
jgi:dihydroorotate dehydrogenase